MFLSLYMYIHVQVKFIRPIIFQFNTLPQDLVSLEVKASEVLDILFSMSLAHSCNNNCNSGIECISINVINILETEVWTFLCDWQTQTQAWEAPWPDAEHLLS